MTTNNYYSLIEGIKINIYININFLLKLIRINLEAIDLDYIYQLHAPNIVLIPSYIENTL